MKLFGYELTLDFGIEKIPEPKKVKKKATGFKSRRWEQRSKDILVKMTKAGHTDIEIGKELHRTPASIFSMRWKINNKDK